MNECGRKIYRWSPAAVLIVDEMGRYLILPLFVSTLWGQAQGEETSPQPLS
ncbi:MAG TPA: hypothetical protein VF326_12665 [Anaerolineaceae bacterium]